VLYTNKNPTGSGGNPSDATPLPIGTATPGTSNLFAREGHVHALPTGQVLVQKHSVAIAATDFDGLGATDTSEVLNLGTALPANARIVGVNLKLATPFTGGGNAAVTLDIGSSGDPDALIDGANLFAAAVDGQVSTAPAGIAPHKHFSASTQLTGTFVVDVGLAELTAGAGTVEILYCVLA
jgi:hypothetical protein